MGNSEEYRLCRRVAPEIALVGKSRSTAEPALQYTTVEVDGHGACLDAEDGTKDFVIGSSGLARVSIDICSRLIKDGKCPMTAWGVPLTETDIFLI